jgi:hypothetical protein
MPHIVNFLLSINDYIPSFPFSSRVHPAPRLAQAFTPGARTGDKSPGYMPRPLKRATPHKGGFPYPPGWSSRVHPAPCLARAFTPGGPRRPHHPPHATSLLIIAALITISTALIPTSTARLGQISAKPQPLSITSRMALLA